MARSRDKRGAMGGYEKLQPQQRGLTLAKWLFASLAVVGSLVLAATLLLARADGNRCLYDCAPYEVHLSLMSDPTSVRVTWRTNTADCGTLVLYQKAHRPPRWLRRLLSNFRHWFIPRAFAVESRRSSDDFCGSPANETSYSLNMYSATLTDLEPGVDYVYMLSGGCDEYEFTAPLGAGVQVPSFSFVAFGDMGAHRGAHLVASALQREAYEKDPRFVVLNGDVAYAGGDNGVWEDFMDLIEPIASHLPWMVTAGNHDYTLSSELKRDHWGLEPYRPEWAPREYGARNDGGGECGLQLAWRFPMMDDGLTNAASSQPPQEGDAFPPFWYAFDYGAAHFVMLSSEHSLEEGSLQRAWLEQDLALVDRCRSPFVIVFHHRSFRTPPFWGSTFESEHLAPVVETLFAAHQVDLIVAGHQHVYYKGCAFGEGSCEDGSGTLQVVIGTGGRDLTPVPAEQADYLSTFGYGRFNVGPESVDFEFVEAASGNVLDTFTLQNKGLCKEAREPVGQ